MKSNRRTIESSRFGPDHKMTKLIKVKLVHLILVDEIVSSLISLNVRANLRQNQPRNLTSFGLYSK